MNKRFLRILFCALIISSCSKDELPIVSSSAVSNRTVIIYMAANNNLRQDAINSINQMEIGAKNLPGKLLVYIKTNSFHSHLLKINYDENTFLVSDTLKTYGDQSSTDPEFMRQVLDDAMQFGPAKSYGLVLWSHATSWTPPRGISLKSFGNDQNREMDIKDLKNALPDSLSFLLFDACSMACVETVYELKDKCNYILASPTETLAESYPYAEITPYLFGGEKELKIIAEKFLSYYSSKLDLFQSATVSLIDAKELGELAFRTKELLSSYPNPVKFQTGGVQRLDFDLNSVVPSYDFIDFLEKNIEVNKIRPIKEQMEKAILFKGHTENFIGKPIESFSGLSCYVPTKDDVFENYYSTLTWYEGGGFSFLFGGVECPKE